VEERKLGLVRRRIVRINVKRRSVTDYSGKEIEHKVSVCSPKNTLISRIYYFIRGIVIEIWEE
jgi:hypothetical protein